MSSPGRCRSASRTPHPAGAGPIPQLNRECLVDRLYRHADVMWRIGCTDSADAAGGASGVGVAAAAAAVGADQSRRSARAGKRPAASSYSARCQPVDSRAGRRLCARTGSSSAPRMGAGPGILRAEHRGQRAGPLLARLFPTARATPSPGPVGAVNQPSARRDDWIQTQKPASMAEVGTVDHPRGERSPLDHICKVLSGSRLADAEERGSARAGGVASSDGWGVRCGAFPESSARRLSEAVPSVSFSTYPPPDSPP